MPRTRTVATSKNSVAEDTALNIDKTVSFFVGAFSTPPIDCPLVPLALVSIAFLNLHRLFSFLPSFLAFLLSFLPSSPLPPYLPRPFRLAAFCFLFPSLARRRILRTLGVCASTTFRRGFPLSFLQLANGSRDFDTCNVNLIHHTKEILMLLAIKCTQRMHDTCNALFFSWLTPPSRIGTCNTELFLKSVERIVTVADARI